MANEKAMPISVSKNKFGMRRVFFGGIFRQPIIERLSWG